MQKNEDYQQKQGFSSIYQEKNDKSTHFVSQNLEKYKSIMGNIYREISQKQLFSPKNIIKFHNQNIALEAQTPKQHNICLKLIKQSINSQVIVFEARWGMFKTYLQILNVAENSQFHSHKCLKGSFGKIFFGFLLGETFAIKCISFNNFRQSHQAKILAVKEYFIMKIAAALQVGPNLKKCLGFDLIMYKNCIQFFMEECQEIECIKSEYEVSIFLDLLLLHNFRVVHLDIKPQNLMFSREFNKPVFIDFGLSHIIDCQIGFKTSFKYQGTLEYCSPEMLNAFYSCKAEMLDLYYNDACCLQKTIDQLKKRNVQQSTSSNMIDQMFIQSQAWEPDQGKQYIPCEKMIILLIKYLLFQQSTQLVELLFEKQGKLIYSKLIQDILTFFLELQPSEKLKCFFQKYMHTYHKLGIEHNVLSEVYDSHFFKFKTIKPQQNKKSQFYQYYANMLQYISNLQLNILNKFNLQNILKTTALDDKNQLAYFKHYLNYINFSNNVHSVTQEERQNIATVFYSKITKNNNSNSTIKSGLFLIGDTLEFMLHNCIVKFPEVTQKTEENTNLLLLFKKIVINIIEHLFILNVFTQDFLITFLQKIYSLKQFGYLDKLQFLLSVKQFNYWLMNRFAKDPIKENIINYHDNILVWCFNKCQILKTQQNYFSWIIQYIEATLIRKRKEIKRIQQQKMAYATYLPNSLRICFLLDILNQKMIYAGTNQYINIVSKMQQNIIFEQKQKFFFFHFKLFEIFHTEHMDVQKCKYIYKLLHKNVNCNEIINQLTLSYKINFVNYQSERSFLKTLHQFLCKFTYRLFEYQHNTLNGILMRLYAMKCNQNKLYNLQQQQKQYYRSIINIICKILQNINIQNYIILGLKQNAELHKCFRYDLLRDLTNIRKFFFKIMRYTYDFKKDLDFAIQRLNSIRCDECQFNMINFCLLGRQNCLINCKASIGQTEIQFMQNYDQLIKLNAAYNKQFDDSNFISINLGYLFSFCSKSIDMEYKYHGIQKLYQYIKEQDLYYYYFQHKPECLKLLITTMQTIYNSISIAQLALFMNNLSKHIQKNQSKFAVHLLICTFQNLLVKHKNNFNYKTLSGYLINESNNFYNCIYYHQLLYNIEDQQLSGKLVKYLRTSIDHVSWHFHLFFQGHLYRYLLFKQTTIRVKNIRKIRYMKKKTVLLFNIMGTFQTKKRPRLQNKNNNIKKLMEKALNIGGPYNMNIDNIQLLYVKAKNSWID